MKKVLLVLAVAGVMVACNNKKSENKDNKDTTTTTTTTDPNTNTTTTTGIPTFADAEVQTYVNDYTAWANALIDAYRTKDMTKISDYSMKTQDWATRTMAISQKLSNNPDDAKKFSDYMAKLNTDLANAAKAMVPNQ